MIIRIRSPEGQANIQIEPFNDSTELLQKISTIVKLDAGTFRLALDPQYSKIIEIQKGKSVSDLGLRLVSTNKRHGDLVYCQLSCKRPFTPEKVNPRFVKQEVIDDEIEKLDGLISREKSGMCAHGTGGMCDYCMPLEPYDQGYLADKKIKHMSFHAFLKKTLKENKTAPTSSHKFIPPLENSDFKVKVPCPSKSHAPYPESICSKCQPSSATLQTQQFRMVDHVEFESAEIIDNFLRFWRNSAFQRFGILFGRYEKYSEVPLGVKAVVSAIYEPPQSSGVDHIQLQDDPKMPNVLKVAGLLGLEKVGVIYTDLVDDGTGKGKVYCKRHDESYFLSSAECLFAANLQLEHAIPCKYSESGSFGSRLVTCVVSGNENGDVDINSYQVSNVAMAMVQSDILEASIEPCLMRVKKSETQKYVPEVFYKYKNEYGIMVKEAAKPTFPVEYLLVTLSHGFPSVPNPTFISNEFPVENRLVMETQSMERLRTLVSSSMSKLSDFHLLLYLADAGILDEQAIQLLCTAVSKKQNELMQQLEANASWQTLAVIMQEAGARSTYEAPESWACQFCTFVNDRGTSCDMCGLPK